MKISPAAELAVRGVVELAQQYGQGPVTLSDICQGRDLPKQYLTKIFAQLAKADIVTPIRGKNGGYVLAQEPAKITLLDVIQAVEGPLSLNYCQHNPSKCDQIDCMIRPIWTDLQNTIRDRLAGTRLSDCLNGQTV